MSRILNDIDVRARPWRRLASAVFAVGVLAGCVTQDQGNGSALQQPATVDEAPSPTKLPLAPPTPPAKPPVQPSAELDPHELVGLGEAEVTGLIGSPGEVRDEPPALVWRYAGDKCAVDVLFYFDLTRQEFRALTYRVEPEGGSEQAQRICLGGIQEAQRGGAKR